MEGWIKLDRKMLESSAFDNSLYFKVFCWCLLRASTKDTSVKVGFKDIPLKAGEFITSYSRGSGELKMHPSCLRRVLLEMQNDNRIRISSKNKYTKISVVKWALYQVGDENLKNNRQTTEEQPKNNRQTTDKRPTTNKNNKNYKNEKERKENSISPFGEGDYG